MLIMAGLPTDGGNQQFTAQRLTFDGCSTAVQIFWDWGWVWKSITVRNADVGFRLLSEDKSKPRPRRQAEAGGNGSIGFVSFLDSSFSNVGTAALVAPLSSEPGSGSTGVVLENVAFDKVRAGVADTSGKVLLSGDGHVGQWVAGPIYAPKRTFAMGETVTPYRREVSRSDTSGGLANAPYLERAKPQYAGNPASDFVHVKDMGARGDGVSDDTEAFQRALYQSRGKIVFVDAGTYLLTHTVTVPPGTKLVGEAWSQLAASGPYFSDPRHVSSSSKQRC